MLNLSTLLEDSARRHPARSAERPNATARRPMRRSLPLDFEPREVCARCKRPVRVCYCAHLTSLETKTRIVVLQHPREEGMALGTAHISMKEASR